MISLGVMHLEFRLSGTDSLKDKRRILKSMKDRLHRKYNVSVTESDYQDQWNHALIALAFIATGRSLIESQFSRIQQFVISRFPLELVSVNKEYH